MLGLQEKTATLQTKYPSAETASLAKDALVLNRKYESLLSRGDKIQDVLQSSLEQHCVDAQQQHVRWLNTAKEKLAWCEDATGDRYSVEAKLATIRVRLVSHVPRNETIDITIYVLSRFSYLSTFNISKTKDISDMHGHQDLFLSTKIIRYFKSTHFIQN